MHTNIENGERRNIEWGGKQVPGQDTHYDALYVKSTKKIKIKPTKVTALKKKAKKKQTK